MNKAELECRTKTITSLMAIWNCSGNKDLIKAYVIATKDVPADLLAKTCERLAVESESRPVPANIIKVARNLIGKINGTGMLPWHEAWKEIEREMNETFVYGTPKFSRPEIKQTVDAFGWNELCEVTVKELPIVRAQLKNMYESICAENIERQNTAYVIGTASLIDDGKNIRLVVS